MALTGLDIAAFLGFIFLVVGISLYASRKEETTDDYFLAGRSLPWWLIGLSLIASNISSEHFIGMAGDGFQNGLAIACFEWVAAIALVFVALVLLPKFLRAGIYTLPEFLEYRYGPVPRAIMAFYLMVIYIIVGMAGILYAGSLPLTSIFGLDMTTGVWAIGILAGGYTIYGGLKAVVWSDMLQGLALLAGGALLLFLSMKAVGGFGEFLAANGDKMHLMLPADHPTMPWTIYLVGIWVPNIAYWGLNQFISQRTLAAKSLAEGQKGIIFAAFLKLLIPFLIVLPGIAAYQLYAADVPTADQAYPVLMTKLLPAGLRGVMFAALFGAVMSSLDSMLNSASTIFTIDIYGRHIARRKLEPHAAVRIGRIATGVFVIIGCLLAPQLASVGGIYEYMQRVWNFIWPGILAVFLMGMVLPKAPARAATLALLASPVAYGGLMVAMAYFWNSHAYLNAAAGAFILCCAILVAGARLFPMAEARLLPDTGAVDLKPAPSAKWGGALVVILTIGLYIVFW
jgi:solute:Na+ symporter, SSS family